MHEQSRWQMMLYVCAVAFAHGAQLIEACNGEGETACLSRDLQEQQEARHTTLLQAKQERNDMETAESKQSLSQEIMALIETAASSAYDYMLDETNTHDDTGCHNGEIADAAECHAVALSVGLQWRYIISETYAPKGCYSYDKDAFFNQHPIGLASAERQTVCRQIPKDCSSKAGHSDNWCNMWCVNASSCDSLCNEYCTTNCTCAQTDNTFPIASSIPSATASTKASTESVCSSNAAEPSIAPLDRWAVSTEWRDKCETKNYHTPETKRDNWCWFGWKEQCHDALFNSEHLSWADLRSRGAQTERLPSMEDQPYSPVRKPELCDRVQNGVARSWTAEERHNASTWFKKHVKVYVMNLDSDTGRWDIISARLKKIGVEAIRAPGVDMRVEGQIDIAKEKGWIENDYNFTLAQANAYDPKQDMGSIKGTLGCASAHFKTHQQIISDGSPLAVVLEDDTWPEEDFVERLWSLVLEELPCDWEVTALLSRCPYGVCVSEHLLRVLPDLNEAEWLTRHGVNWGMQGNLYRTDKLRALTAKWQKVVFVEERPHALDVDVALASISDSVGYYAVPAVQAPGFLTERKTTSSRWSINDHSKAPGMTAH